MQRYIFCSVRTIVIVASCIAATGCAINKPRVNEPVECSVREYRGLAYSFMVHPGHLEKVSRTIGTRTFDSDAGLTAAQAASLRNSFLQYGFSGPEPDLEGFVLYDEDGHSLRYRMWDLDNHKDVSSIPVELVTDKLDDEILRIIYDVASTADLIFTDFVGENVRFVARSPDSLELERWNDAARIDTINELRYWIEENVGGRTVVQDIAFPITCAE